MVSSKHVEKYNKRIIKQEIVHYIGQLLRLEISVLKRFVNKIPHFFIYSIYHEELQIDCNKFFTQFVRSSEYYLHFYLNFKAFVLKHLKTIILWSKNIEFKRILKSCLWWKWFLFTCLGDNLMCYNSKCQLDASRYFY